MKKQLVSCFLAICMAITLPAVFPSVHAANISGISTDAEELLADIHYDSNSGQMVSTINNLPGELDQAAGGQKIAPGSNFNYNASNGGVDSLDKEVSLTVRITPKDTNSDRFFQAFAPAGGNRNLVWFKAGGEAGVIADNVNQETGNTFVYAGGHTYVCTVRLNMVSQTASATVRDETAGATVYQSDSLIVPEIFPYLPRIKVSFEGDGTSSTVLHEMRLVQKKPADTKTFQNAVDLYYDPAEKKMMPEDPAVFDYSGCPGAVINESSGGLELFVWGNDGQTGDGNPKNFSCKMPNGGRDSKGKVLLIDFCMTMKDYGTNRKLVACHDGGQQTTVFESNPGGDAKFFDKTKKDKPPGGKKYNIRLALDPAANKAKVSMLNLSDKSVTYATEEYQFDFDQLETLDMILTPKLTDGKKVSILHSISIYQMEKTEISLKTYATGMPPYTEGDTAEIRLERTGEVPQRVSAFYDAVPLGGKVPSEGFAWSTPVLEAGIHRIFAVAEYEDGTVLTQKGQIEVKRYAGAVTYLESNCTDSASLGGIAGVSKGGVSGKGIYQPMPQGDPGDTALLLQPDATSLSMEDYDQNHAAIDTYNMNYNIAADTNANFFDSAQLAVWESDILFLENKLTPVNAEFGMGCLEVRFKDTSDAQKDKILVSAKQDGNLSFIGSSLSVPYEANTVYHLTVQLNKNGMYNIIVKDGQGPVFSGYNLKWYEGGVNSLTRFKYQQNAVAAQKSAGSYLDNIKIYSQREDGVYLDTMDVRKGGAPLYDLSEIKSGQEYECRASIKNCGTEELAAPVILLAILDEEGSLIDVGRMIVPATVPAGGTSEVLSVKLTAAADLPQGAHVKAYVWSDLNQIQPVTKVRTY